MKLLKCVFIGSGAVMSIALIVMFFIFIFDKIVYFHSLATLQGNFYMSLLILLICAIAGALIGLLAWFLVFFDETDSVCESAQDAD